MFALRHAALLCRHSVANPFGTSSLFSYELNLAFSLWFADRPPTRYDQAKPLLRPHLSAELHLELRRYGVITIPNPRGRIFTSFAQLSAQLRPSQRFEPFLEKVLGHASEPLGRASFPLVQYSSALAVTFSSLSSPVLTAYSRAGRDALINHFTR